MQTGNPAGPGQLPQPMAHTPGRSRIHSGTTRFLHARRGERQVHRNGAVTRCNATELGGATIPGIVTATRKFTLCLTPDEIGQPREPTEKSLMDFLCMMEISDKKVWLCIVRESNGIHTGYFFSMVKEVKAHVAAYIRCPIMHHGSGSITG